MYTALQGACMYTVLEGVVYMQNHLSLKDQAYMYMMLYKVF